MERWLASGSTPAWLLVLLGLASLAATGVGVYRKLKSGEIEDDGTLLDRVSKDNVNLRAQLDLTNLKYEDERLQRRHAEDAAAIYYRQLIDEKLVPKEVPKRG